MTEYDKEDARKTIEIKQAIEFVKDIKRAISYQEEIVTSLVKIPAERAFNLDTILEALKEKAEREKGCEYCNVEYVVMSGSRMSSELIHKGCVAKFCPMCGRKLVSEE